MSDRIVLTVNGKVLLDTGAGAPVIPDITSPVVPTPAPPAQPSQPVGGTGVLQYSGGWVRHPGGNAVYSMPAVGAGQEVEVSVSAGWELILLTIRDPGGNPVLNKWTGLPVDHLRLETGYGNPSFIATIAGDYTVELDGGGSLTTVNHWRR